MSLWDDVKSNLAEWYTVTSEKTTELARISTRRYDKFGISREIERQFSELGNLVYMGLKEGKEGLLADPTALDLVARIQRLEAELGDKDREIKDIKQEYAKRQAQSGTANDADSGEMGPEESSGDRAGAVATVITDPVLGNGRSESAILMEPGSENGNSQKDLEP